MAIIRLHRTKEYSNYLRDYIIYIDGQKAGTIRNGETKEFNIPEGNHSIYCKIDWCSSPERIFDVRPYEAVEFRTGGFKQAKWLLPAGMLLILACYLIGYFTGSYYQFFLLLPFLFALFYFISFGRKRYLFLERSDLEQF